MELINQILMDKSNFIFLGEAGSGKSEIAINFAKQLSDLGTKAVHFFDMDMTKPLFRSRDVRLPIEHMGITFHCEEQFMDAPTLIGGVNRLLKDKNAYVVLDVGGDHIGARSIGGFQAMLNSEHTIVYYVLNAYRPWSHDIKHIDGTLGDILLVSHIHLKHLHLINNPNIGPDTTAQDFLEGSQRMRETIAPYKPIDFSCVKLDLYEEVKVRFNEPLMPIKLHLTYPWIN